MRFLGQIEVAEFVKAHPRQGEALRAWVAEVRHHNWPDGKALSADFPGVDLSKQPSVVFHLRRAALTIETLVSFRTGCLLLTAIRQQPTS